MAAGRALFSQVEDVGSPWGGTQFALNAVPLNMRDKPVPCPIPDWEKTADGQTEKNGEAFSVAGYGADAGRNLSEGMQKAHLTTESIGHGAAKYFGTWGKVFEAGAILFEAESASHRGMPGDVVFVDTFTPLGFSVGVGLAGEVGGAAAGAAVGPEGIPFGAVAGGAGGAVAGDKAGALAAQAYRTARGYGDCRV